MFRPSKSSEANHANSLELIQYKQWVLWRKAEVNGLITKIPISPWTGKAAASDRPRT
jgi:hypothetical protein